MKSMRLVNKGRNEPRDGLVQQGKVHVGLAKKHAADLKTAGFSAERTVALEEGVANLESKVSTQADERSAARELTRAENEAIDGAKTFIRRLRTALPMALRDAPVSGVDAASFAAGEKLKRSPTKVAAYLVRIHEAVEKMDDNLMPYFEGKKASDKLDAVKTALDAASADQEVKLLGLPQDTLAVYETKGMVLEMIEDLNRTAKIAFDGQPSLIAEFNKDVLERARKRRAKEAATPAAKAPDAPVPSPAPANDAGG